MKSPLTIMAVLSILALSAPDVARACRAAPPSPQGLVANAEIIVRATAVKYLRAPEGDVRELGTPGDVEIEFKVEDVLKGQDIPSK